MLCTMEEMYIHHVWWWLVPEEVYVGSVYIYSVGCSVKVHEHHIYSTLFKTQERKSDRTSKEIEQRKESQNTHTNKTRTCDLNLLH